MGNWTAFDVYCGLPIDPPPLRAGDGSCPDEEEDTRSHNTVNELTIWSPSDPISRTTYLSDLIYDRAGNLLANPLAGECVAVGDCVGHFYKYGPWGRLQSVYELGDASVDENGAVIAGALGPLVADFEDDASTDFGTGLCGVYADVAAATFDDFVANDTTAQDPLMPPFVGAANISVSTGTIRWRSDTRMDFR
ncbi:MAG: hypothetical protein GY778_11720 [bacterium]|nr:hypothetical protein [bacterium]